MILKGLKARLGNTTVQMQPFTIQNLRDMYSALDKSDDFVMTLWCILVTSFRSLLGKSNLVPTSGNNDCHVMMRQDIEFHDWGVMRNVRSTKTLQFAKYVLQVSLYYVSDQSFFFFFSVFLQV